MIDLGAFTNAALDTLRSGGALVGDGVAPQEGGWTTGAPNMDAFVAYSVLSCEGAVPAYPDIGRLSNMDWAITASMRHHGGTRAQCDFQAAAVRSAAQGLLGITFGAHVYKVIEVVRWNLGAMTRIDQLDPPFWSAADTIVLGCSN